MAGLKSESLVDSLARKIFEILPPTMQKVRMEMREAMDNKITLPQFRILASIFRGRNQVSEIAKYHGVSLAALSRMAEILVERGLIEREVSEQDRRHIHMRFTKKGEIFFKKAQTRAEDYLKEKISQATAQEQKDLEKGLSVLDKLFADAQNVTEEAHPVSSAGEKL